ncbi:hypothetical protein BTVI_106987 [Pitangus sulphuratus]|nr:hypothetical protein BTVI_106987 [Pitangus sulphuratus]
MGAHGRNVPEVRISCEHFREQPPPGGADGLGRKANLVVAFPAPNSRVGGVNNMQTCEHQLKILNTAQDDTSGECKNINKLDGVQRWTIEIAKEMRKDKGGEFVQHEEEKA